MEINNEWHPFDTQDKPKNPKITSCSNCKLDVDINDFNKSDGYIVCTKCGLVLRMRISDVAEWCNYTSNNGTSNNSRCGSIVKSTDVNPYTTELTSFMPKGVKNVIFEKGIKRHYDISRLHVQSTFSHLQKSFHQVEKLLENCTDDKYSKRVVTTAKLLWAEVMKSNKVTRAGVRKGMIACCLYYACVHHDCTRSPLEICKDFGMKDTKQFNKGDKEFKETFETIPKWQHLITKTSNSDDYFTRFCSILEVNHIIREGTSFVIAKECRETFEPVKHELFKLFPKSAACGILFWVLRKNGYTITKVKLSGYLGICNPTLSKTVKEIEQIIGKPN